MGILKLIISLLHFWQLGTGDILAGLIGSFLAQGYSAFQAASYGCYIHSQSAIKLDRNFSASELTNEIPFIVKKIININFIISGY